MILKKIFDISVTLFGVVTIIFFLFNVLPGDPAQMMLGQNENSEQLNILKKNKKHYAEDYRNAYTKNC